MNVRQRKMSNKPLTPTNPSVARSAVPRTVEFAKLTDGTYVSPVQVQDKIGSDATRDEVVKTIGKFVCPGCDEEISFVRECERSRSHFRHKPDSECNGETVAHKVAKGLIVQHQKKLKFFTRCHCGRRLLIPFEGTYAQEATWSIEDRQYRFDIGISTKDGRVDQAIEVYQTHAVSPQKAKDMDEHLKRWCEVNASEVIASIARNEYDIVAKHISELKCSNCHETDVNLALCERMSRTITTTSSKTPYGRLTREVMRFIRSKADELGVSYADAEEYKRCLRENSIIISTGKWAGIPATMLLRRDREYVAFLAGHAGTEGLSSFPAVERRWAMETLRGRCCDCLGASPRGRPRCIECYKIYMEY